MARTTLLGPVLVAALLLASPLGALSAGPVTGSRGEVDRIVRIRDRCPTFSWGAVPHATRYELSAALGTVEGFVQGCGLRRRGAETSPAPGEIQIVLLVAGGVGEPPDFGLLTKTNDRTIIPACPRAKRPGSVSWSRPYNRPAR